MNLAILNVLTRKTSNSSSLEKREKSVLELMIARTARFCKKSIDQYQFLDRRRYVTATFTFPLKRLM